MEANAAPETRPASEILEQTFARFFEYVAEAADRSKATDFARQSYQTIQAYFHNLSAFQLNEDGGLKIDKEELTDKDVLAFSVWMQQFLKLLRNFMIGLGRIDPAQITEHLQPSLKQLGFYEYFEQAKELNY